MYACLQMKLLKSEQVHLLFIVCRIFITFSNNFFLILLSAFQFVETSRKTIY